MSLSGKLLEVMREALAEDRNGFIHLVFDCLNRNLQDGGNLVIVKFVVSAKDEDRATSFRKKAEGFLKIVHKKGTEICLFGVVHKCYKNVIAQVD